MPNHKHKDCFHYISVDKDTPRRGAVPEHGCLLPLRTRSSIEPYIPRLDPNGKGCKNFEKWI